MNEEWRDIEGFEGSYQVSNTGKVRSLDRMVTVTKNGKQFTSKRAGRELSQWYAGMYMHVTLVDHGKMETPTVHRLVAKAFIENPNGLPWLNHKDEDKLNNHASNLEWCTPSYNRTYGNSEANRVKAFCSSVETHNRSRRAVLQIDKDGKIVGRFFSVNQCQKNGYDCGTVVRCCKGRAKTYKGFIWKYEDEYMKDPFAVEPEQMEMFANGSKKN